MNTYHTRTTRMSFWLTLSAIALAFATPPYSAQGQEEEGIVVLSPFEVTSDVDEGYWAANTLAGSRLATPLIDTPSPISVMTRQFLDDIAATSVNEALEYGLNTTNAIESFTGNDHVENNFNFRMRGISGAQRSRNYFRSDLNNDTYNIERLDFSRGPNSILFGEGSPAGMINTTTKFARLGPDSTETGFRIGSFNEKRATLDVNRTLRENFAVRANAVWQESDGYREFEFQDKLGIALASEWRPYQNTRFRIEGERLEISETRARPWTGYDLYSFWVQEGRPGVGSATEWGLPVTGVGRMTGSGQVQYFHDGAMGGRAFLGLGPSGEASYFRQSLGMSVIPGMNTPANTLDFNVAPRNSNLYGPASRSDSDSWTGSAYLEQRVGDDLVFEVAAGLQREDRLWVQPGGFARNEVIFDANAWVPQFDSNGQQTGTIPNPNFGQQIIGGQISQLDRSMDRTELRATASYHLQLDKYMRDGAFVTRLLGRHQIAGLLSTQQFDMVRVNSREVNVHPDRFEPDLLNSRNNINRFSYIDPFSSNPVDRGMRDPRLFPINNVALAGNTESANDVAGVRVTSGWVQNNHRRDRTEFETGMIVMQNYFWDDRVVGLFGWRRDTVKSYASDPVIDNTTQERVNSVRRSDPDRKDSGNTTTRGVVVHVVPNLFSVYYNESDNFTPQVIDEVFSDLDDFRPVGHRIGNGQDAGMKFTLLDNRVYASLGWYKTADDNQRTSVDGNYRNLVNRIWEEIHLANPGVPLREVGGGDTRTVESKGYEAEITANPFANWRVTVNYKKADTETTDLMNNVAAYVDANRALWMQHAGVEVDPDNPLRQNVGAVVAELDQRIGIDRAPEGRAPFQDRRTMANVITTYNFNGDGFLSRLGVGSGVQYRGKSLIGYRTFTDGTPVYAPSFYMTNAWLTYSGDIPGRDMRYRVQFNVDNLLNHLDPQPIQSGQPNPDNPGRRPDLSDTGGLDWNVTLPVPRRYTLSATLTF